MMVGWKGAAEREPAICTWHVFPCPTQHCSLHVVAHFPPGLFLTILKLSHVHLVTSGMGGCAVWGVHLPCSLFVRWTSNTEPYRAILSPVPSLSPCPLVPPLLLAMAAPAKKAKMDFLGQVSRKYVCSGDPEISDAKDVVTYLSEKYTPGEWKKLLQDFADRFLHVTGQSDSFPTAKSTVPDVTAGSTEVFWVMVWHLGHLEVDAGDGIAVGVGSSCAPPCSRPPSFDSCPSMYSSPS